MDFKKITKEYYSKWLGTENGISECDSGIHYMYSAERNKTQPGYSKVFDVWAWKRADTIIISYGDNAKSGIDRVKSSLDKNSSISSEILALALEQAYEKKPSHNIKYVFEKIVQAKTRAKKLIATDYPKYLDFFTKNNPNCTETDLVKEYFDAMILEGFCCCVFENEILASCTDAPFMPYMQDDVREIGVNTLHEYRGKGYAKDSCIMCANEIINKGKCPLWSTSVDNIASQHLAEKTGFIKLADVFCVTL